VSDGAAASVLARARTRPWYRPLARVPMLAFRLGLRRLVGRLFMLVTTTGRTSGVARTTMVAFQKVDGHRYAAAAYGSRSHWYRNLLADARVTLQSADGIESCTARPITDEAELRRALERLARRPLLLLPYLASTEVRGDTDKLVADRGRILLVTFEPTTEATPPAPAPDLLWVWPAAVAALVAWRVGRARFPRRRRPRTGRGRGSGAPPWRGGRPAARSREA
jgi:deazaflavin-dependent oxidoreductase (nitroreductase family)